MRRWRGNCLRESESGSGSSAFQRLADGVRDRYGDELDELA